jgi:hypothetical protein
VQGKWRERRKGGTKCEKGSRKKYNNLKWNNWSEINYPSSVYKKLKLFL